MSEKINANINKKIIFIEKLTIKSFIYILLKYKNKIDKVYYIHKSLFSKLLKFFAVFFYRLKFSKLDFKLTDIRDKDELVRFRIDRLDLFEFKDYISNLIYFNFDSKFTSFKDYIFKSISYGSILNHESPAHLLYLLEVINWYKTQRKLNLRLFLLL